MVRRARKFGQLAAAMANKLRQPFLAYLPARYILIFTFMGGRNMRSTLFRHEHCVSDKRNATPNP
jgi:hypothetical protein